MLKQELPLTFGILHALRIRRSFTALLVLCLALPSTRVKAQWHTESILLDEGWNGVYLPVDLSYQTIDELIAADPANPVQEIWQWTAPGSAQFYGFPGDNAFNTSGWTQWKRDDDTSNLGRLTGGSVFLVRSEGVYTWMVKGKPVVRKPDWNLKGLNLLGFPVPSSDPPDFSTFIVGSEILRAASTTIYRYQGDSLSSNNPVAIPASLYRYIPMERGEAYWVDSGGSYTTYNGPLEIDIPGQELRLSEQVNITSLRIKNRTLNPLQFELRLMPSESAPEGETAISGQVPVLLRGALITNSAEYGFQEVVPGQGYSWELAGRNQEGSEVEIVLGIDRGSMQQSPGSLLAGLLKVTDSLGQTEQYIGLSTRVGESGGLWVGQAVVTQVGQYLKTYQHGAAAPILVTNGNSVVTNDLMINETGQYIVSNLDTSITDVPRAFPLRLIVHAADDGSATLLQRVYIGSDASSNRVVTVSEQLLDSSQLSDAVRISSVHLPWTEANDGWGFTGSFNETNVLTATVALDFDDQRSNPFLHTYHPDHDNLNEDFDRELTSGRESYSVERTLRLQPEPPGTNFSDRVAAYDQKYGTYEETIRMTGLDRPGGTTDTRVFEVKGIYRLDRINGINELTRP